MADNVYLTYYQKNRDVILNRAKEYYKNNKDKMNKQAREKYNNSPEEKLKILEYEKNRYHNMYEAEKKNKEKLEEIDVVI